MKKRAAQSDPPYDPEFTVPHVAKTLGVSRRTILRWIDSGELEARRSPIPGGPKSPYLIKQSTLTAYQQKLAQAAT